MKKIIVSCILIVIFVSTMLVSGCNVGSKKHTVKPIFKSTNVLEGATIANENWRKGSKATAKNMLTDDNKSWKPSAINRKPAKGQDMAMNTFAEIKLKEVSTFNTAIIKEIGDDVLYFRLLAYNSSKQTWETFYQSEKIEKLRLCSFDAVTTDRVKISIDKFRNSTSAKISFFGLYNEQGRIRDDFTVAAYQRLDGDVPSETLKKIKSGDPKYINYADYYNVYNTIIVFAAINWDRDGNLLYSMGEKTQELNKKKFGEEIAALKEIIELRSDKSNKVSLICTTIADGLSAGGINVLMNNHKDKVIDNTMIFLKEFGFNGVDIDWEYPQTRKDWSNFDYFITKLDDRLQAEIPNKVLSGALSAWALKMQKETLSRFDQIQFMAYDGKDKDGFQSGLQQAQDGVSAFVKNGADPKKINIGIAAYGRPLNGAPYWPFWRDLQSDPDQIYWNNKYYNVLCGDQVMDAAYCSPALAGDKLAYALMSDIGGVMVFRLACDKFPDDPNSIVMGLKNALNRHK